jgi:O-antigen/teichoic acid export membrane protein
MSLIFVFNAIAGMLRVKVYKELDFKCLSISSILGGTSGSVIGITMALNGLGIWSLVFQSFSTIIITSIYLFIKSRWIPKLYFKFKLLKDLWGYSFRIFISTFIGSMHSQIDNLIIGKLFSTQSLGYYYRAKSMEIFTYEFSSKSILTVMFPIMSSVSGNRKCFDGIVMKSFHVVCFVSFTLLAYLYLVSYDLIILLISEKWISSIDYFKLLLIANFAYPIGALTHSVLASSGNSKAFLNLTIIRYLLLTPSYLFLYYYGIIPFLYSFILINVMNLFFYLKFLSDQINVAKFKLLLELTKYFFINLVIAIIIYYIMEYINLQKEIYRLVLITILFFSFNYILFYLAKLNGFLLLMNQFNSRIIRYFKLQSKNFTTS